MPFGTLVRPLDAEAVTMRRGDLDLQPSSWQTAVFELGAGLQREERRGSGGHVLRIPRVFRSETRHPAAATVVFK